MLPNEDDLLNNPNTNGQAADFKRQMEEQSYKDAGVSAEHIAIQDQPKPVFTIEDLAAKLAGIYNFSVTVAKDLQITNIPRDDLKILARQINADLQELVAIVDKCRRDLQPIDVHYPNAPVINQEFKQEKPDHYVCGVQLIEQGKLVGTSLYTTIVKARTIRDILNKRFAELKVNHEAKIVNYPVF